MNKLQQNKPSPTGVWFYLVIVFVFLYCSISISLAQTAVPESISLIESNLKSLEAAAYQKPVTEDNIKGLQKETSRIRGTVSETANELKKKLTKISHDLEILGEAAADEPADVTETRKRLNDERALHEKRRSSLRLLELKLDEIATYISSQQKNLLSQRLLARGPMTWDLLMEQKQSMLSGLVQVAKSLVKEMIVIASMPGRLMSIVILAALFFWLSRKIRKAVNNLIDASNWDYDNASLISLAIVSSINCYLPVFLLLLAIVIPLNTALDESVNVSGATSILVTLSVLTLFTMFLRAMLYPPHSAKPVWQAIAGNGKWYFRKFMALIFVAAIGYVLVNLATIYKAHDSLTLIIRDVVRLTMFLLLFGISVIALRKGHGNRAFWQILIALLLILSIAELLGYRNLVLAFLGDGIRIVLLTVITIVIHLFTQSFFVGLDSGQVGNLRLWLRGLFGLKQRERLPGLFWYRFLGVLIIWTGYLILLLHVIVIPPQIFQAIRGFFLDGFTIGSLPVVPARILIAVFVFVSLYLFSSWLRIRIEKKWFVSSRVSASARDAMATVTWYSGIAIAILATLGVAGVTFTNLAIIAGALSVGIGFGLQNIVNNFVSGLILLFERPIKPGDWVVVGSTEGYVRRISIRSTQIQTFDKADIIVPNSDLISNQVTNWMLNDRFGRVRVPVGVAYGTDTALVRDTLLEVAGAHEEVIKNDETLKTKVLFLGFGDSSLNFELRCFIKNIDNRLQVLSDLNFAIDAAFREKGIQIPFPQRDLHFRNKLDLDSGASEKL